MWDKLKNSKKNIVLYGGGDGAEKILAELERRGITVSGIFASDEFVRSPHKQFHGMPVMSYAEAKERFGDMTVLVCFGSDRPDVIENVNRIAEEQDLYAPDVPVAGTDIFDSNYLDAHRKQADEIYELLSDRQSRLVFRDVINYKLNGWLPYLYECETPDAELWKLLSPGPDESYLDLGAYTGDTVTEFIKAARKSDHTLIDNTEEKKASEQYFPFREIYAFEPDARNYRKLTENLLLSNDLEWSEAQDIQVKTDESGRITAFNLAAYSGKAELEFAKNTGRGNAALKGKTISVKADSVDHILGGKRVTLVKMDVEGLESEALCGMETIIREQRPKLLIAAYHRSGDLWDIPKQILSIRPDYRVYLRKSPCIPAWEVNYIFL